jgi:lipopolysaccharide transport protein LptA
MMRSDEPIDVTSELLDVNDITKVALFKKDVRAKQGEAGLTAAELEVRYTGKAEAPGPTGAPPEPKTTAAPDTARLTKLLARGGVVLTKADSRAESAEAVFDATTETGVLLGNLVMTSGTDRKVTGDRADLDQRKDTALVTGAEVVAIQGPNIFRGRRLFVDRKSSTARLDSPSSPGLSAGRIAAHMIQKEASATSPKAPPKEPSATPAPMGFMAGSFKSDPTAPMDVDADVLDVDDKRKTATFTGNVIARQGAFEVRSSELVAYSSGDASLMSTSAAPAPPPGSTAPKAANQLVKVETRQKVVITGNDGQSVTGNWAVFDAKSNTATVGGDVLVGQGKNVVRGPLLKIDLTTGHYNFVQEPTAGVWPVKKDSGAPTLTAAPKSSAEMPKLSRPSLLIFPKDMKERQKKKEEARSADDPKDGAASRKSRTRVPEISNGWQAKPATGSTPSSKSSDD